MTDAECPFCGAAMDSATGKYGCPNCHGEGLDDAPLEGVPQPEPPLHLHL